MTLIELLDVLKTQSYVIWKNQKEVGIIHRGISDLDNSGFSLNFSNEGILDLLDDLVDEIIPLSCEIGGSKCQVILTSDELPFG